MKKITPIMIFSIILCLTTPSHAHNMGTKLIRGFSNLITAPVEIPKQTYIYWKKGAEKTNHVSAWVFSGFIKGMVNTVGRLGSGLWDVMTFNIEKPENYEPLMKPACVFEDWNEPPPENSPAKQ